MTLHDACSSGTFRVLTVASLQQLKMEVLIPEPADCEVWSVITFLNAQSIMPIEIRCRHMARQLTHLLQEFGWEMFNPYSAKGLGDRLYATLHKMPGEDVYSFCLFLKSKTLHFTHLEATSYIPQQVQSLHFWTTSLFTTGCYKNKYTTQFSWMACISRFVTTILSGETDLALGTIRVKHVKNNERVAMHFQCLLNY